MSKGVLLLNIGTPKSFEASDVEKYLKQFLTDPDVVNLPWILRWPLVNWLIAPRRAPASAEKYKKIWLPNGSPLLVYSEQLAANLRSVLGIPVEVAMRYGEPSFETALTKLQEQKVQEIVALPMFPQFAQATTGSVTKYLKSLVQQRQNFTKLRFIDEFYGHSDFIRLSVEKFPQLQASDFVLFSFHGLPVSHLQKDSRCRVNCLEKNPQQPCADPQAGSERRCYRAQCYMTAKLMAEKLGLKSNQYSVSFQSRLGPVKWIEPYTDHMLVKLAQENKKSLVVACPAFTVDCLETLEEIGIEMRQLYLNSGGESFRLVSCLNNDISWAGAVSKWLD